MNKGVSTIVAVVLIAAIGIGLTSTAYIWGTPLIEKRQEATITERVYKGLAQDNQNSLPGMIKDVANNRGMKTFNINTDGLWVLNEDEDSIEFQFSSKTANVAANTANPISLTSGVQCSGDTPKYSPVPATGILGQDNSAVTCVNAISTTELFTIRYKIWFRELVDNPVSPAQGFKIDLVKDPTGLSSSSGKTVRIIFDQSSEDVVGQKTLITKKIKILLI